MVTKRLVIALLLILVVIGCKSATEKKQKPYPKTARQVALAFTKAIQKGNFQETERFTNNLKTNGATLPLIQKELDEGYLRGQRGTKSQPIFVHATKDVDFLRFLILKKIYNKWKIIETYVDLDVGLKAFYLFLMRIELKDYDSLRRAQEYQDQEMVDFFIEYFKDKKPYIKDKIKLKSAFQKTLKIKVYRKGTKQGLYVHAYKGPNTLWKWHKPKITFDESKK